MKLGISLQYLADSVQADNLECLRQSKIETLEIASRFFHPDTETPIAIINDTVRKGGLKIASIHASFGQQFDLSSLDYAIHKTAVEEILYCINNAKNIGAGIVIAHSSTEPIIDEERPRRIQQAIDSFNEIKPFAVAKNVKVAVELLPRSCVGNTADELLKIIDQIDSPFFRICLDVNHLMDQYATLPDVVRQLGSKLMTLHLSDYDGVDEKHWFPGKGVLDWQAFISALQDIGYQGPFNYETPPSGDNLEEKIADLESNFEWLSGLAKD